MIRHRRLAASVLVLVVSLPLAACGGGSSTAAPPTSTLPPSDGPTDERFEAGTHAMHFDVAGQVRTAVVAVPDDVSTPRPLVFVFHGHGGSGASIDRRMDIEGKWPDAIVVYPDGLVGHKGKADPDGVEPGWQTQLGESGDRDLAFFDTMLETVQTNLTVDRDRIYVMGHSNGSQFASLVLNQRGDAIAASANLSAAPPGRVLATDPVRSMFIAMGTGDPIVPYDQQKQSIPLAETHLGVDRSSATVNGAVRSEVGPNGVELETYIYEGGHEPPPDAARLVVEFFQRHTLR